MKGQWVTCVGCDAPWVDAHFYVHKPETAAILISGLGFFELYINGRKVSDDLLTPAWTDYSARDGQKYYYPLNDVMRHRVLYREWNISEYLCEGRNDLSILLGNGWYSQRERKAEGEMQYGAGPILWFEISWSDASGRHALVSDENLTWHPSRITQNNVYTGETQDLRLNDDTPRAVKRVPAPDGELTKQDCPSDKVIREIFPLLLKEENGECLYDAGENMTGWAAFTADGEAGEEIVIRYAELLGKDGALDFSSGGKNQIQTDRYVCSGERISCRPHFTWHAFRYFTVRGRVKDLKLQVVHSDVPVTAAFECSDETLNWLFHTYLRTRLNNMHCGVPSDCPHRERLGYTGDGQATAMTDMYALDGDRFYRKWIRDILDGQDEASGHIQHTAPFYGGGGGPGGWGGAVVLVPWAHYRRYGDLGLLRETFPAMKKWIQYMFSRMDERGAVVREEPKGWCLGDWCAPETIVIPEAFVNTCYLARCLGVMLEIAEKLGEDEETLKKQLDQVRATIRTLWWDSAHYADGAQGADALALEAGLNEEGLAAALAEHYRREPWFDTGFLATGSVVRQLFAHGYAEEAVALLTSETPGHSFGWQRLRGADTLWERWDGADSHDHPFFGGVVASLFEGLMGVSLDEPLTLSPCFVSALNHASCRVQTRLGSVAVSWRRTEKGIALSADLPAPGLLKLGARTMNLPAGHTTLML